MIWKLAAEMPILALNSILIPFSKRRSHPDIYEPPFRSEVFGIDRLEELAVSLAKGHQVTDRPRRRRWLDARLDQNRQALNYAHRVFEKSAEAGRAIVPAAEWLLDNFYIVRDQFREIQQDMTQGYYRELPVLVNGPYAGYPRVYGLAVEVITHTDSRLDSEILERVVKAYETVAALTSGELWAFAIMLRLALIENLRRLMDDAVAALEKRELANSWADRLLELPARPASEVVLIIAELARSFPELDPVFAIELLRRLQDQHPSVTPAIHWIEERLAEQGTDMETLIRAEHQRLATNRVSIGNVVSSMRALGTVEWAAFYENTSVSEQVLRSDPLAEYGRMEFASRDLYRHVVEKLSRRTGLREDQVARRAIRLAEEWRSEHEEEGEDSREVHVGYYLLGRGLGALKSAVGYRPTAVEWLSALLRGHPTLVYLGSIALLTAVLLASELAYASANGGQLFILLILVIASWIPMSTLAIGLVDRTVTAAISPRVLPKLEFKGYIPERYLTIIAVPALISSKAGISYLLTGLENRLLSNQDSNLYFALLTDFPDAPQREMPEDQELLETAIEGIRELNAKYGRFEGERFYLFHRERTWNEGERAWIGWERKRGKLIEFNRLLRGAVDTHYVKQVGDLSVLPRIKYVITLDADTQLPLNSAKRLVGTIAHPLNRARIDESSRRVVEGYGIIQPRTSVNTVSAVRSRFENVFAQDIGLDPYSHAASNVYQDLFGVGIFVGKAIYDVDVALSALSNRFPENWLLSHDLLEGLYARTGLASDIQLLEDFPSGFDAFQQRQHRWVRGDWQIADWLAPTVPTAHGHRVKNALPLIDRWMIFDNLRRSLQPATLVLLLILGWIVLPGSPLSWTFLVLFFLWVSYGLNVVAALGSRSPGEPLQGFLWAEAHEFVLNGERAVLTLTFLLSNALSNTHAILQAWFRRWISHRHMLEWTSAAAAEREQARTLVAYLFKHWIASAVAVLLLLVVALAANWWVSPAVPFVSLWGTSALVAFYVSLPVKKRLEPLTDQAYEDLRGYARRTWRFFEEFVCPEDHWLPPDHFQEDPLGAVVHHTSPTNIGFYILSTIAAFDLGYLAIVELAERLEKTIETILKMERYRGHLLNWYETTTLNPLIPKYVSSVDSGNLIACLIVMKQACLQVPDTPVISVASLQGLADTASQLSKALEELKARSPQPQSTETRLVEALGLFKSNLQRGSMNGQVRTDLTPMYIGQLLNELRAPVDSMAEQVESLNSRTHAEGLSDLSFWSAALKGQLQARHKEIESLLGLDGAKAGAPRYSAMPSLRQIAERSGHVGEDSSRLEQQVVEGQKLLDRFRALADRADSIVAGTDFRFLYDEKRQVFTTGCNLNTGQLDSSFYDLLASESRLSSFIAIALGQVPEKHWFQLGRPLTRANGRLVLLSWGGTMFEYLMPPLLMSDESHTLLEQSYEVAVQRQIEFGAERKIPWGVSEAGFYAFDFQRNYQYRLFGVPELGLKRDLGGELVIAPYATFLALGLAPKAAWTNLKQLEKENVLGRYGFYEAIDYTPSRRPVGQREAIVRSFMSHHHGMSLVALDNFLNQGCMKLRFNAESTIAATGIILEERIPTHVAQIPTRHVERPPRSAPSAPVTGGTERHFTTPHTVTPRTHLLSNGTYTVMLTNSGGGYSAYKDLHVTRWREDVTRDNWGAFCYIKDIATGEVWSTGYQPVQCDTDEYEVTFRLDKAEFVRRDFGIESRMEVWVSPEDNAEVRRIRLTNTSRRTRTLELTSYAELVLEGHSSDLAHPAFGKLFVETEFVPHRHALLFKRRPRSADEAGIWAVHLLTVEGRPVEFFEYETDRARFIGRGHDPRNAQGIDQPLSRTVGAVLDPIMSLRCRVQVAPGENLRVVFTTGAADSREGVLALADEFSDARDVDRIADLAFAHSDILRRHLGISAEDAQTFQRLASRIIYPVAGLRALPRVVEQNVKGQSGLWPYGLSGDNPILLVRVDGPEELSLVRQALLAFEYWRLNNFKVDLVILNGHPSSYIEGFHSQVQAMIDTSPARPWLDKPGGVFLRRDDHLPEEDRILLQAVARVVLDGEFGSISEQLDHAGRGAASALRPPKAAKAKAAKGIEAKRPPPASPVLLFNNGLGGFSEDDKEYVINLSAGNWTPAPWVNALANPEFGCLVTESGLGHSWWLNAQLNKLTPWSNDPVSDTQGQVIYLKDEISGKTWTPTPLPIREEEPYLVHHGAGYTRYEHTSHELAQELTVYVTADDPVLVMRLALRNLSSLPRVISVIGYFEWVLGTTREQAQHTLITQFDQSTGAILARNTFSGDFGRRIAFAAIDHPVSGFTADRTEFLGRNGSPAEPAGLERGKLARAVGGRFDPCAALQTRLELLPRQQAQVSFLAGQADDEDGARKLVQRYQDQARAKTALAEVKAYWDGALGMIEIHTPDRAMDLLVNRWLLYQTLAGRYWARTAFYQSGGAYGFRDQLQDVLALVHSAPQITREHILRAASHQFLEGDVQHWWHPPGDAGLRTRISDDPLWLTYATVCYLNATGDDGILDESVPYLKAPRLEEGEQESYNRPASAEEGTLYEHCLRALEQSLKFGEHGLPLMGAGDWNDGMNHVGIGGKGESVWLGWFLYYNLARFREIAERRSDSEHAASFRQYADTLRKALDEHGWDGRWYLRAFLDDGTPLGSAQDDQCKIDSIAQSWAVISQAGQPERNQLALRAVEEMLVREQDGLVLLLTPPFDNPKHDPGYIQGYLPGIRENGGHYTHAAAWLVLAYTLVGDGDRAYALYKLMNPINHALENDAVARYKVEPYVVAGDIYSHPAHLGRGGWTWYTGAAGWMYRVAVEHMLGLRRKGNAFVIDPCVPRAWSDYRVDYRFNSARYEITVLNPDHVSRGVVQVELDGAEQKSNEIALVETGNHNVRVVLGNSRE